MEDCEKVGSDDAAKLKKMGDAFRHPKQLVIEAMKGVLLNGVQIYHDIKAADNEFSNGSFEAAGKMYGEIGASVLFGGDLMGIGVLQA